MPRKSGPKYARIPDSHTPFCPIPGVAIQKTSWMVSAMSRNFTLGLLQFRFGPLESGDVDDDAYQAAHPAVGAGKVALWNTTWRWAPSAAWTRDS